MRDFAVLLLASALTLGVAFALSGRNAAREWEARAAEAESLAERLAARALAAEDAAKAERARADSAAAWAEAERSRIRPKVVEVREIEVPAPCEQYTAPRDTLLDALAAEADGWREAWTRQKRVAGELRAALDLRSAAADSLAAVLADRPAPRNSWWPDLAVGPFVGVCADVRPCAGVGVTLSWSPW